MKLSSKRRVVLVAAAVVLAMFLLRPGASRRLKAKIAGSISAAVARPVEIGSVHIRLLPRPGFDLENLVVYDDPAFGAEPMLRAGEVTAVLRLTSLVRGRLEIARLDLAEPSLNLVHGENGRWNLEALLERAAQTPLAPTAKAKSEPRPGFPYIEGSAARINFKTGQEKKPYALINADFSLWQDSENAWGVRLKAQPFRSDLNLSDTGVLRVNGTWQRAARLRETPLRFSLEWDRPQFGQLTKLVTGSDKGWRGAVQLDVTLAGTPEHMQVTSDASIRDFRRYDISRGDPLLLAAHCDGRYSSLDHALHELFCRGPVGKGSVTLHGDVGLPGSHRYDLVLMAENIPASALIALAQRAKKGLPQDLAASGDVDGSLSIRQDGISANGPQFLGSGGIANLRLVSAGNKAELDPQNIPFVMSWGDSQRQGKTKSATGPGQPRLEFGPFPVAMGRTSSTTTATTTAQGWVSRSGYSVSLAGEAEVARALRVARLFGLPALTTSADGVAQVDLQIAGSWAAPAPGVASGFLEPQVTGTTKLHNVRAEVRGVDGPIEISSAELRLARNEVRVTKLSANAAHALWSGSLELPRGCGTPGACEVHFNLNANEIGWSDLSQWVSPRPKERPWYRALTSARSAPPSFFTSLRASGKVTTKRLRVRDLTATHVSANVILDAGKLRFSELRGDFLGGKHRGEWQVDFGTKPAVYTGTGTLSGVSLEQFADAMNDGWIEGTANASYQVKSVGASSPEFWKSAEGTVDFEMRDGVLPHVALVSDAGGLKVESFEGRARLLEGKFEIKDGRLDSPVGTFDVSGTASLSRVLDLQLTPSPEMNSTHVLVRGYNISGTVAEPQVVPVASSVTQAQLKP